MIVYKITNKINGKVYIGQTINAMQKRWRDHKNSHKQHPLQNSMLKHGKENFSIEQIDSASSQEELNEKEAYWINFYDSRNSEKGYNLREAGSHGSQSESTKQKLREAHLGMSHTEETKQRLSEVNKGKHLSDETRLKISQNNAHMSGTTGKELRHRSEESKERSRLAMIGKNKDKPSPWKGKHPSEETKQKMRLAKLGKPSLRKGKTLEEIYGVERATEMRIARLIYF